VTGLKLNTKMFFSVARAHLLSLLPVNSGMLEVCHLLKPLYLIPSYSVIEHTGPLTFDCSFFPQNQLET
jgi:hypothetical protein